MPRSYVGRPQAASPRTRQADRAELPGPFAEESMKTLATTPMVSLLVLVLSACAPRPGAVSRSGSVVPDNKSIVVNVTNNYGLPVEVAAIGSGTVYRMGIVSPGAAKRFLLQGAMLATGGAVEFVARPLDRAPLMRSGLVRLKDGDEVEFEVTRRPPTGYAARS